MGHKLKVDLRSIFIETSVTNMLQEQLILWLLLLAFKGLINRLLLLLLLDIFEGSLKRTLLLRQFGLLAQWHLETL